jgi:hypothetical protein
MEFHHPILNVMGVIERYPLESGRQACLSWGRSQPDLAMTIGEICRQHLNIAVFLGGEHGYDYFLHVMGIDVPDDATGIDFANEEYLRTDDDGFFGEHQAYGQRLHVLC